MKITIGGRQVWLNYHHLYCFFVISREGSIAKASAALSIGRSALSIQMKQFEQALGTPLFERGHRKLALNESGRLLFSYSKEIFRLGGEMVEVLLDKPPSGRVHLQIGAPDSMPKHLTLQVLKAALESADCSVSILEGKSLELLAQLKSHKIDLLLTDSLPLGDSGAFYHRQIARFPLWVAGDRKSLALRKGFPASLNGLRFVLPTADGRARQEAESFFKKHDISVDLVVEAQDLMIQKLTAQEGLALTVVPEFAIREFLTSKKLFLVGPLERTYETLYLVSAARRIENPVAARLMASFKVR